MEKYIMREGDVYPEYLLVEEYYKGKSGLKSGRPYMAHIVEGLMIMDYMGFSTTAKRAFCIHPLFQNDEAFLENRHIALNPPDRYVVSVAIEYRLTANAYLPKRHVTDPKQIVLSKLDDVNNMLIADKIQNKKDFMKYVLPKHHNKIYLLNYFDMWLRRLDVTPAMYKMAVRRLEKESPYEA